MVAPKQAHNKQTVSGPFGVVETQEIKHSRLATASLFKVPRREKSHSVVGKTQTEDVPYVLLCLKDFSEGMLRQVSAAGEGAEKQQQRSKAASTDTKNRDENPNRPTSQLASLG